MFNLRSQNTTRSSLRENLIEWMKITDVTPIKLKNLVFESLTLGAASGLHLAPNFFLEKSKINYFGSTPVSFDDRNFFGDLTCYRTSSGVEAEYSGTDEHFHYASIILALHQMDSETETSLQEFLDLATQLTQQSEKLIQQRIQNQ